MVNPDQNGTQAWHLLLAGPSWAFRLPGASPKRSPTQ